ncbi:hypothetical protein OR16_30914 [Cupriavidus basilensis OR16]|uniref:Uncharacterized protein n=1 Tax=Cupriavidus basilensis OR16 TaxID=1127483 RepID=H1SD59_9BURK|nr:hypothetical protein OR16_30914 [Cupriavidus basilensis OR16]
MSQRPSQLPFITKSNIYIEDVAIHCRGGKYRSCDLRNTTRLKMVFVSIAAFDIPKNRPTLPSTTSGPKQVSYLPQPLLQSNVNSPTEQVL